MGSKRPVHVSVRLGGRIKTIEQLIRKFARLCKDEGIVKEVRERSYFISKNQRRRRKKYAAKMRHMRKKLKK